MGLSEAPRAKISFDDAVSASPACNAGSAADGTDEIHWRCVVKRYDELRILRAKIHFFELRQIIHLGLERSWIS